MKQGSMWRDKGGNRIEYDPGWSPSLPYKTFRNGTAGRCCATLEEAKNHLGAKNVWSRIK